MGGLSHPERFDPHGQGGKLIDAEHRARYWWAAKVVEGADVLDVACGTGYGMEILRAAGAASVTGVDVDPDAVRDATRRQGGEASVVQGDIQELPLPDDSFDVAVCWETIEHVADAGRALDELHRVLRPGGLLLVSSPNPDVYAPGNEHHVREYRPSELAAAAADRFAHVESYRQHPWLSSAIEPAGTPQRTEAEARSAPWEVRATLDLDEGDETYGIVAASDASLAEMGPLVALGSAFEVRWWSEHVESVRRDLEHRCARSDENARQLADRLRDTGAALLEANQSLARLPLEQHRFDEAQAWYDGQRAELADLRDETDRLRHRVAMIEESRSWRAMAPLRRVRAALRRS